MLTTKSKTFQQLCRSVFFAIDGKAGFGPREHFAHSIATDFLQLGKLLIQHPDPDCFTVFDPTAGRLDRPGDQTQQRRLPGPVCSENSGTLPRCNPPRDVAQDLALAEADTHVFYIYDVFAKSGHSKSLQLDRISDRRHIFNELSRGLDPKLGFGGACWRSASEPRELFAHEVLAFCLSGGGHPVTFYPLQHVGSISALERFHDAVMDFPGLIAYRIKKPPVVGNH